MSTQTIHEHATHIPTAATTDLKLEVVVIPVSDVDRAKRFYEGLGWRLDADFANGEDWRVVQMTPPGSPCSIISARGSRRPRRARFRELFLVVSDIEAARAELIGRGVDVSEAFHFDGSSAGPTRAGSRPGRSFLLSHSPHSAIPTATAGCSSRSRRGFPGGDSAWTWRL